MGIIYNRSEQKDYRQYLRTHGTWAERLLWSCLKGRQVHGYKFRRQYGIHMFVVDFYCPQLKLAIEVDGITHEDQWHQKQDRNRQRLIESYGVRFLRFTDEQVLDDADKVVQAIAAEIERLRGIMVPTTPVSPPR